MPLETTPWDVTDAMTTERCRLSFVFACVEDDPEDEAFFTDAIEAVERSRRRHGFTQRHPMTLKRFLKTMAIFPTVPLRSAARIGEALGYGFDVASLDTVPARARTARAAAKRTRSATRTQRRPT